MPQVPRAPVVDLPEAVETAGVAEERHKFSMFGSRRLLQTNLGKVSESIPNQGFLISELIPAEEYVMERWFNSRRFATLPESGALLYVSNVRGRNVLTRIGAWKERNKHVGKRECAGDCVEPLGTTGPSENVDVPWLRLRENVDYQKASHELFVI